MKKVNSTGIRKIGSPPFFVSALFIIFFIPIFFFPIPSQAESPKYGGRVTLVSEVDPKGFDAIESKSLVGGGRAVASLIMEKLFKLGEDGSLVPALGLSAVNSPDGKTWTVPLRRGVRFHDGTPFNADAVVSHWQRLLNPENRFRELILLRPIQSVEKTGEFEVRFHLEHPWAPFPTFLTTPASFTALIPSPTAVANGTHNLSPVGTGPFILKEWKRGDSFLVARNPNYWQEGKPYLDEFVFRAIPDHGARYAALGSGQADLMFTDRPMQVKQLEKNPEFQKYTLVYNGAGVLALNNRRPPLDDVRVRRALALAWDQKKYLNMSFQNIMPYAEHWFGPDLDCGDVGYLSPNAQKARELLAEYGKPVELEYIHSATNRGKEAGAILQQLMKQVGVKIKPIPSDFPGIIKRLMTRNYDITSWLIFGTHDMGPMTKAILHSKSSWNVYGYADENMDQTLEKLDRVTDPRERKEIMCGIARKVNAQVPFLYLFGRTYYLFARNRVKNVALNVLGEEGLELAEIWVDQ